MAATRLTHTSHTRKDGTFIPNYQVVNVFHLQLALTGQTDPSSPSTPLLLIDEFALFGVKFLTKKWSDAYISIKHPKHGLF